MIEERWAGVEDYPNYAISNHGKVMNVRFGKLLKPRENSYGLQRVTLYKESEPHDFYVHHLVAAAFIDGYIPGLQIRHGRDGRDNNNVYNLRFKEGQRMGQLIRNPRPVSFRRVMIIETGRVFRTVLECANHIGGHPSSIYRVLRGDRPSHLGYTFQYVEEST